MTAQVINLGEKTNDATYVDVATLLRLTADEIDKGELKADKLLAILVDTSEDGFKLSFRNAQMKSSQMIAACECMKGRLLSMMGFVHGPDSD